MADRFPLILNTNTNQIQEIPSGDNLDLTGSGISNAGIITANNVTIGAATTDLIVNGDARITGILTVGTSSLKLDGPNNLVNVGTALTLGHTQGVQFHTQNLHSAGFEVNQINASGIITATEADINGNGDVSGNLNVGGVVTVTGAVNASHSTFGNLNTTGITIQNTNASINFTDTNNNPDYSVIVDAGVFDLNSVSPNVNVVKINTDGHIDIGTNVDFAAGIDVTGNVIASGNVTGVNGVFSGNLSVGGVLTYEDVTNIDSVGIITARTSIKLDADGSASSNFLSIGADDDLKIFHQSNVDKIESSANGFHIRQINNGDLHIHAGANTGSSNNRLVARAAGAAELYHSGNLKLSTTSTGATVNGTLTATTFSGSGAALTNLSGSTIASALSGEDISGLGNVGINATLTARNGVFNDNGGASPTVKIRTDDQSPWAFQLGNDTYWNNDANGYKIYQDNSGNVYTTVAGNGAFVNWYLQTINGGTTNNAIHIDTYRAVHLKYQNNQKLATTNSGISVTGNIMQTGSLNVNDSQYLYIGNSGDLRLHHDQVNTINYINSQNGVLRIQQGAGTKIQTRSNGIAVYDTLSVGTSSLQGSNVLSIVGGTQNQVNIAAGSNNSWGLLLTQSEAGGGYHTTTNSSVNKPCAVVNVQNDALNFGTNNTMRWTIDNNGHLYPGGNGHLDIGKSTHRVGNLYTSDLHLSNEAKGGNSIDNTWGDWTIQEGESDLFLINNRSGKKYKFNLTEVS